MEQAEATEPRRRRRGAWLTLTAAFTALALALGGFVAVVVGPLQSASAAGTVVPGVGSSPSPIAPTPAVSASPTLSPGGEALYAAPVVTIEPPPPPPTSGGKKVRAPGVSYIGYTAAEYCALKLPAFATSGSDPTAFLTAANKERAQTGAPALTWNSTLAAFADSWSAQMASDQDAHPEWVWGSTEWYAGVFRHSGGPYAENIAVNYGYSNPVNEAQSGWMKSTGHCKSIMNPSYTQMGAGKAQASDGTWYFTEEFTW